MNKALILATIILTGCGMRTQLIKNGVSQAEIDQDNATCSFEVDKVQPEYDLNRDAIEIALRRRDIMTSCLKSKGYKSAPVGG